MTQQRCVPKWITDPVKKYPPRKCKGCGSPLSQYNPQSYCSLCRQRSNELLDD
jgi:uncharacterized OB-fold protein